MLIGALRNGGQRRGRRRCSISRQRAALMEGQVDSTRSAAIGESR
jgi:hypothetical protein